MRVVHKGFDTITLSIQANIPPELFEALEAERESAEEERTPRPFTYGGADFDLMPYGGNGYRFILKGGFLDAQWFFKKPNAKDPWGIRINIGSLLLATQGLGYARAYIDKTLTRLGVRYAAHQVSIARADFCVDVLAPDFDLNPENIVTHSRSNRADHQSGIEDIRSNGRSGRFTSVTVGKMPGRQVIIYDKRREIIDKKKPIWWEIWNANLRAQSESELTPDDRSNSQVWRIEIRAGKDLLKDRWQIREWAEFDDLIGDVMAEAISKIRYCEPDPFDSNRARWPDHPLWELVSNEVRDDLEEMRSFVEPSLIKDVHRNEHIQLILGQVVGSVTSLAALEDQKKCGLRDYFKTFGERLQLEFGRAPDRIERKFGEAKARYRFVE